MLQDLRFTFRMMSKEPWYTVVVLMVLAFGIGVNATGFTIINAAFLRGPDFKDEDRLYMLSWQPRGRIRSDISYPELQDLRSQTRAFTGIAAFRDVTLNISDDRAQPEHVQGAALTANAFAVLQQSPLLGRDFAAHEDVKGAEPVAILSYRLWQRRYAGDRQVLGTTLRIDGRRATIIGVMPDKMNFPNNEELWIPFVPTPAQEQRDSRRLTAFGRLRDGAGLGQAQAELNGIAQRLATAYPESNQNITRARIETITQRFVGGGARVMFPIIMAAGAFVLLIACANVANLLLSRSANRAREIAVRIALGASRRRVLRQLLVESVVLACLGGGAGLFLASTGIRALDAVATDPGKPYWIVFTMDYAVFAYVASICVLTGILFGLAPALHVSKTNLQEFMRQGGRSHTQGQRVRWFSGSMVVAEVALSVILLVAAGLLTRSFLNLYQLDVDIRTDDLMVMRLQLPESKYATPESRREFYEQLEPRLSSIPGIESVAISRFAPLFGTEDRPIEIDGRPARASDDRLTEVGVVTVSPRYFDVLEKPVRRGRVFNDTDGTPGAENVIINERLAAMFFPNAEPLGKRIRFNEREPWRTIVGVSGAIPHSRRGDEVPAVVYVPWRQEPPAEASLIIRSPLPLTSVMDAARREVWMIDPDQPVAGMATLEEMLAEARWGLRTFGSVFAVFAFIALVLSAVGLYGVMAYAVNQRTQEIGIRIALGAQRSEVSWLILKRGFVQLAGGLSLGLFGALAVSGMLQSLLVRVSPFDPITFAAITVLMIVVAVAACMIPARRATRIDPLAAIRL